MYWIGFLALAAITVYNSFLFAVGSWQLYHRRDGFWNTQQQILDSVPASLIGGLAAIVIMVVTG